MPSKPVPAVFELSKNTWVYSLAATIILAVAIISGVKLWISEGDPKRSISVKGECITKVEKDRTSITLRVTVLDRNASASLHRAQIAYAGISEYAGRLKTADPTIELQTTRFDSAEKNKWNHAGQEEIFLGYETNIELSVSSENRGTIEDLLSHFANSENVFPGKLAMYSSIKKMGPAIEGCIKDAVKNAREKADIIARAGGTRVGRMISADFNRTAGGNNGIPTARYSMARVEMIEDGGGIELFSSDTEVSITINAVFGLR